MNKGDISNVVTVASRVRQKERLRGKGRQRGHTRTHARTHTRTKREKEREREREGKGHWALLLFWCDFASLETRVCRALAKRRALLQAALFALGVALSFSRGKSDSFASLVLAFGLFGFAGGVTNWLAVKMLFDRIPGLIGSGVIPRRFQDILGALKTMIIETFFEEKFLRAYLDERSGTLLEGLDLKGRLEGAMGGPGFDEKLATKLEQLSTTPEGMMLATLAPMFGGFQTMVPMIKPMLVGVGLELVTTLTDNFDLNEVMDVKKVRAEIERVLDQRMQTLTPAKVKRMMSTVIKEHLGWLVVWGNVFGGLIGIAAWLADY